MLKIIPNPDKDLYNQIAQQVKDNDNCCPCALFKNDDTKCPCKDFREQDMEGECHCGRYIKVRSNDDEEV